MKGCSRSLYLVMRVPSVANFRYRVRLAGSLSIYFSRIYRTCTAVKEGGRAKPRASISHDDSKRRERNDCKNDQVDSPPKTLTAPPKSRCLRRLGRGDDSRIGTRFSQAVDVSRRDRLASKMSCYQICILGTHGPKCRIILLDSLHEVCDEALATDRRREVIGTGIVDLYLPEPATFDRTNAWQTVKVAAAH